MSDHLSVRPSACPSICLSVHLSVCLSVSPFILLSVHPSIHISDHLSVHQSHVIFEQLKSSFTMFRWQQNLTLTKGKSRTIKRWNQNVKKKWCWLCHLNIYQVLKCSDIRCVLAICWFCSNSAQSQKSHFSEIQLVCNGWTDRETDQQTDRQTLL